MDQAVDYAPQGDMLPRLCKCVANLLILEYILHITSDYLIFVLFFRGELNTNNNAILQFLQFLLALVLHVIFVIYFSRYYPVTYSDVNYFIFLFIMRLFVKIQFLFKFPFPFFTFINTYVIIIHENILVSTEYPVYRIKDNPRKQPTPILFASDGGQTCRQREMVTDALPYNLR